MLDNNLYMRKLNIWVFIVERRSLLSASTHWSSSIHPEFTDIFMYLSCGKTKRYVHDQKTAQITLMILQHYLPHLTYKITKFLFLSENPAHSSREAQPEFVGANLSGQEGIVAVRKQGCYALGFQINWKDQPQQLKTLTHSDKETYLLDHYFYLLLLLYFLTASLVVTPVKILHSSTSPPVHNRASIMIKTSQISFVIINRRCSSQHFILIPTTPEHACSI